MSGSDSGDTRYRHLIKQETVYTVYCIVCGGDW